MAGKIKVPSELVPSQSNKIMLRSKYVHDDVKGHDQEYINNYLEEKIESKVIEAGGVNWDTVPTAGSNNAVKSKDIKAALEKVTGYFVLDSNVLESTVAKTVTVADFPVLAIGGSIKIKMLTKNTATNPTLKIGPASATAYPLYYNNERASATNTWEENEVISVYFDGTNYQASNAQGGGGKAEKIKYDNTESGLVAENVQEALDESLIFKGEEKNMIPRYLTTKDGFMRSSGGTWMLPNSSRPNTHKSISVVAGELYEISANTTNPTIYAFLQTDQIPSTADQPIDLVTGTSVSRIEAGETKYIKIPEGCTTLAFNDINNPEAGSLLPSKILKLEERLLNSKIEELDFDIDNTSDFDTVPIPFNIKVFISPSSKTWLVNNSNYNGSLIYVQDNTLKYKITANANYNTRIVALTDWTTAGGEEVDTFATGDYDTSEFCVDAGETKILKFPAETKFLWVAFKESSTIDATPQYIGVEKTLKLSELNREVCLFDETAQVARSIGCQINAGDILHIEVEKGETAVYVNVATVANEEIIEFPVYLSSSSVDKYFIVKYDADAIRLFSNTAVSKFKISKVKSSSLKKIEFHETCDNIVEVAIQDGTPVPYYFMNGSGQWQQGQHVKSYIIDIPDEAKSIYIVPHNICICAFLSSNTLPTVANEPVDFFEGRNRMVLTENTELEIPNGCRYIVFVFHYYSNKIVTDAAPYYIGFRFDDIKYLNKYKLEQPYSSIKLSNNHIIMASETMFQKDSSLSQKTDLSVAGTTIVRTYHSNALGKYYMYLSEDHSTDSPIYMAYSDNLLDWTYYGIVATELGLLGTAGDIEWPSVIWDDFNNRYLLYTHALGNIAGLGYAQTEFICESTDGINWTYVKPFVTIPKDRFVGNFHNGYVKVHKDGGRWNAYGLIGGGDAGQTTQYYSYDGLNWLIDPLQACNKKSRCLPYTNGDITGLGEAFIKDGEHVSIDGKNYIIAHAGSNSSGTAERTAKIHIQEVLDNRIYRGKAYPLTSESQSYRDVSVFIDDDGEIYVLHTVKYPAMNASHKRRFYVFISKLKK